MNSLIIVDDDPMVCQGLSVALPWNDYGFQVESTFPDGRSTLDYLLVHEVDLVITDIKMPAMNGVELIEEIRRLKLSPQILILSGYDDVEYLRKAITLDVVSYLLKPIQIQELISNLQIVIERLGEQSRQEYLDEGITELKNTLFRRILSRQVEEGELRNKLDFLDCPDLFDWPGYVIALTSITDTDRYKHPKLVFFRDWEQNVVVLGDSVERFDEVMPSHLDGTPIVWPGDPVGDLIDLSMSYHSAWQAFSRYRSTSELENAISGLQTTDEIREYLVRRIDAEDNLQNARELVFSGILNLEPEFSLSELNLSYRFFSTAHSREVLKDRVETLCDQIDVMAGADIPRTGNPTIDEVMRYVNLHITEGISLGMIADIVKMNPSYLGQLFHETTGTKFTRYVKECRLEKACRLLRSSSKKIKDIAELAGFGDLNYFSRVFAARYGCTPTAYREKAADGTQI